jgi:hypothetical protein
MALVSEECLNEWRMRNSWVYINFAYLFSNKLWKLRVPGGFSACPYFWVAMFSMLIFKPVLEPILLGLGKLIKLMLHVGGAPFMWWDKFMYKLVNGEKTYLPPTGGGILVTFFVGIALAAFGIFVLLIYTFYKSLAAIGPEWTALFWWVTVNIGCMIPTVTYIVKRKYADDRCKVEWYNLICFIISTIVLACLYSEMFKTGVFNIGHAIMFVLGGIWWLIKLVGWVIGVIAVFIGHYGWIALVFTGKWLFVFALVMIPVLLICAAIGGVGLLLMKILDKELNKVQVAKAIEVNKVRKVTDKDWKDLLYYAFSEKYWVQTVMDEGLFSYRRMKYFHNDDYSRNRYLNLMRSTAEKVIKYIINDLKISDVLINMPFSVFERIKDSAYSAHSLINWNKNVTPLQLLNNEAERLNKTNNGIAGAIYDTKNSITNTFYTNERLISLFEKNFKADFDKKVEEIDKELERIIEDAEQERLRKIAAKKRHDEYCKMLSTPIAKFFTSIFMGIKCGILFIFVTLFWKYFIIKGVCFTGRQIKIFLVYMWVVLKHLKHGACPYLQFIDPPADVPAEKMQEKKA